MQVAIRELQDATVVMAHLEKKHAERLTDHAQEIAELAEFRRRTEQNLAEITDKLNGLIGYIDNQKH
jgi:phosphate uptake regulator